MDNDIKKGAFFNADNLEYDEIELSPPIEDEDEEEVNTEGN